MITENVVVSFQRLHSQWSAEVIYIYLCRKENVFKMNFSIIVSYKNLSVSLHFVKIVFAWLRKTVEAV